MRITNVSPLGDLDIPLLGRIVEAGETVDVSDDQAAILLAQHSIFEPADKAAKTIAGRHAAARDAGLPAHDPAAEAPAKAPDEDPATDPADTDKEQAE